MNGTTEHPIFYWHDSPGNRFRVDVADFDEAAECPHCVPVYSAETVDRLRARVASLEESLHYANGVADLAMKHRDDAENRVAELEQDAEIGRKWRADSSLATWFPFTAEEIERLRGLIAAHVNASNNDDSAGDTFGALAEAVQDAP